VTVSSTANRVNWINPGDFGNSSNAMGGSILQAYRDPKPELLGVLEASRRGLCDDFFGDLCLEAAENIAVSELGLKWDPMAAETARLQVGYMGMMWNNQEALLKALLNDVDISNFFWSDHIFDPSIGKKKVRRGIAHLLWSHFLSVPQI
jgi:hypothetical protein